MEIDLVVQKRLKPNSTEIETLLMEPNEAFWRFASEIQPWDITSSCFDEGNSPNFQIFGQSTKLFRTGYSTK